MDRGGNTQLDQYPSGCYVKRVKVRDALRLIQDDGWFQVRSKGSHRQFHHAIKKGTVTISGHQGIDIPKGTLNSILKQAGLKD
jgi:predicted RNA binding protein YcfA (HicA-like mRNA interferase family)